MLITVTRTGGFAGVEKAREIDTRGRRDAERWEELAHRAVSPSPDGFHYRITVDDQVIDLQDPYLSEDQRKLIRALMDEAA
ncbi:protealysin inhibitor emfourin [Streptomyces sp. NPDC093225]|uniref:protealysin inhibitor emfourin n=1 Tax=Streptomyces sp. NPDC093225 TaxID=3366034 RepID=UPI00381A5E3A